ncbi:MAG TPA: Asp-tRNA(Asn)/Glu-tRNA(Gln) amidotransferase subunit GatA, partial [Zoogloea sp.]|nr:Asp-tRNA(Asn)/Glu-tRNA(Gln) amidotransferase subunit GatA [Zoogloea sp.]
MIDSSLKDIAAALRDRKVSAVELATESLARIEAGNPKINAFVTVDRDGALAAARAADERLAAGQGGPLTGIPLAHKDVFCTEGVLTTCGSKMLANFVSPYDAHVVSLLKAAGTVMVGKANMDEFAMGSSNENSHFGPTRNPWNTNRVPGGSSGGSAAAVAARMVPIATGTDTGGSIRQPAALCGITGIKPTYGRVSRYGMIAYASSLDQGGAFGRSAEDCAVLLSAMAGHDPRDSTSLEQGPEDFARDLAKPLAGLRIGLPKEFFAEGMSDDVRAAVEAAIAEYRKLGATTVEVSLPNARLAIPAYYVIAPAEASSNLSRFDGVRYGHRAAEYGDLNDMYCKSRAQGFGGEVKRRILVGTYVLSHGYYDAYYIKAQKLRRLIANDFAAAFTQCDVIAGPVSPTVAFGIGEKSDDPVQMYLSDIYTIAVNLAG